jgi:hypothetical protein
MELVLYGVVAMVREMASQHDVVDDHATHLARGAGRRYIIIVAQPQAGVRLL